MNEEVVSTPQRGRRKTVPLVVLLAVIILAGLTAYFFILKARLSDPAALVPKDVALAATIDLTKSSDKDAAVSYIKNMLKDAGVDNPEKELFESIDKELKISIEKDVLRHLNGLGAFAVLTEMGGMMPSMVVVIGAKSDSDAKSVMTNLGDSLNKNKVRFSRLKYKDYYYYRIPTTEQVTSYIGQVKNNIVYATSESGMKTVIETAEGKPSLLEDKNFVALRQKNSTTFASIYYSGAGYYKLIRPLIDLGTAQMGPDASDWFKKNIENMIAAVGNAEADADGLKLSFKSITQKPSPTVKDVSVDNLAAAAPKDAAFVCAFNDWSVIWSEMKKQLTENPSIKSQIDQSVIQTKQMLQIDLFNDVLDRITAIGMYYTPKRPSSANAFPGHLTFVLTVDKPNVIKTSLSKINNALGMFGNMNLKPAEVAGETAFVGALDKDSGQLANALVGDKVIITISGSGINSGLQSAILTAKGKADTASTTDGFKLLKKQLPGKGAMLVYMDLEPVYNAFRNQVSTRDSKTINAVMKKVGVIGGTSSASGTKSEGMVVIPFKK